VIFLFEISVILFRFKEKLPIVGPIIQMIILMLIEFHRLSFLDVRHLLIKPNSVSDVILSMV